MNDDLEITRLCAEAMGVWHCPDTDTDFVGTPVQATLKMYDPLHDDAQAMALVKHVKLDMVFDGLWSVGKSGTFDNPGVEYKDLNRAICSCVAKMQTAKGKR